MTLAESPTIDTVEGLCDGHVGAAEMIRDTFAKLGDKWSLLLLGMLDEAPARFTALRDRVPGISHRMLTLTLRGLEPRVEYAVTALGRTILPTVKALAGWAFEHSDEIQRNRGAYDNRTDEA
jgi:DNA-binding HxlR family transcriptional regulator